jgi:hypothetical protein
MRGDGAGQGRWAARVGREEMAMRGGERRWDEERRLGLAREEGRQPARRDRGSGSEEGRRGSAVAVGRQERSGARFLPWRPVGDRIRTRGWGSISSVEIDDRRRFAGHAARRETRTLDAWREPRARFLRPRPFDRGCGDTCRGEAPEASDGLRFLRRYEVVYATN